MFRLAGGALCFIVGANVGGVPGPSDGVTVGEGMVVGAPDPFIVGATVGAPEDAAMVGPDDEDDDEAAIVGPELDDCAIVGPAVDGDDVD